MFNRVSDLLGANWTLHDLRHTASYRLARDPNMPLTKPSSMPPSNPQ